MRIESKRRSSILVIDDAVENIRALGAMLEPDYEVRFATRAEQGLALASERPGPDLVLLDVVMPGMDGFTACRRLKEDERTRFIPVVLMTSLDALDDRVKGIEAGADDYLTKPVDERQLLARIRTALRAKHLLDQRLEAANKALQTSAERRRAHVRACPKCCSVYRTDAATCALDGSPLELFDEPPLVGRRLDRYDILGQLGQGAMGDVYLASHATLKDQRYAIKILGGALAAQPDFAARFRREAEACARLDHPNVVQVLDFGTTPEKLTWLVMEYVVGRSLQEVIEKEAPLPAERVANIARQLAAGLAHVHAHGLVHRDVKPQNVLVSAGDDGERVKLLDFGIVGLVDDAQAARLTQAGALLGTPLYMAPEQHRHARVGPAADLYALGATMCELLTGRPPFAGGPARIAEAKLAGESPSLDSDTGLKSLVRRLMALDPAARPTAEGLVDELDALVGRERPRLATPLPPLGPPAVTSHEPSTVARPSRRPSAWLFAALVVLVAAVVSWLLRR